MKISKVVLIGNFDGIHLGHQKLISKAKKIAEQKKQKLDQLGHLNNFQR